MNLELRTAIHPVGDLEGEGIIHDRNFDAGKVR
jgi:hypothetical protein